MMMFSPGQEVMCIDDTPMEGKSWASWHPVKGEFYTVVETGLKGLFGDYETIKIAEEPIKEWAYRADRFAEKGSS